MDNTPKIKVALICLMSNSDIRDRLPLKMGTAEKLIRKACGKSTKPFLADMYIWNTNLIEEIRSYTDKVEMHVIAPYPYLAKPIYEYDDRGVYYHFFRNREWDATHEIARKFFPFALDTSYKAYRKQISSFVQDIKPDIVHVVGIENPYYAAAGLDCPSSIPLMVQLQTLMIDPVFKENYPISEKSYQHRSSYERQLLERADYICTSVEHFVDIIDKNVNHHAKFINTVLPLAEPVNIDNDVRKEFDFVYYAANINKAADLAIEGFILASQQIPGITLDVVGAYDGDFKKQLEDRLESNGLLDKVTFEGRLPTHDDVLGQIRKSRFALLPLKIDLVSGTIRESMANGLPVITTITQGTPALNKDNENVLLSSIGDHQALAENMVRLYNDNQLQARLRSNGAEYMTKKFSNQVIVKKWVDTYCAVARGAFE